MKEHTKYVDIQDTPYVQTDFFADDAVHIRHDFFDAQGAWWDAFGEYLRRNITDDQKRIRTLSLFSGAGGLDIGFHDAGFDIVEAVELDPKLAASLEANVGVGKYFGDHTSVIVGDICDYDPDLKGIDFIIGGPPCQTFSAAGARASGVAGTKDDRGNLFEQYVRVLKKLKPRGFLFENVYRILGANKGRDWDAIRTAFAEAGYKLQYRVLDTADYGAPQHRERLIIVGVRDDLDAINYRFPLPTHGPDSLCERPHSASRQALYGINEVPDRKSLGGRYGHLLDEIPPGLNYSFFTEKMGHPSPIFSWRSKFSDFLYKADPDAPVRTIKAQGGQYTGPFHWDARPFTIREYKRLQTFPDRYEMVGSKVTIVKQIGNSVPPQFARMMALSVREQIFSEIVPVKLSPMREGHPLSFRKLKRMRTKLYEAKARTALTKKQPRSEIEAWIPGRVDVSLSDDFSLTLGSDSPNLEFSFIQCGDQLTIRDIKAVKGKLVTITIKPAREWTLPFSEVILDISLDDWRSFTTAWKLFEQYLIKNGLKADLEQLNGYYQYAPRLRVQSDLDVSSVYGGVSAELLASILSGETTRQELPIVDLAERFELKPDDLLDQLRKLKSFGYAVRTSNTNVAMANDTILIPYAFPTLNKLSVQRNKTL